MAQKTKSEEYNVLKRNFNNESDGLYRAQEIVSPYPVEIGRYERKFLSPKRKYYKRDKDFTPEERSKILARVSEVGATRAADEFGTRRWVIMQWLDNLEKFGSIDNPTHKNKKNKNKKRGFTKQNFVSEKSRESLKHQAKTEKTNAKVPELKLEDFEFNFDDILEANNLTVEIKEELPLKTSSDFSLEERAKVLDLASKIGIKKAAIEAHTKIDTIKYWRKISKKNTNIQPSTPINPIVAENKILKAQIADLETQKKELSEQILISLTSTKD